MTKKNVLLLTGANNHDWKRTAPCFQRLLEDTGQFRVDVTDQPEQTLSNRDALKDYQLFFVDYNGPRWGDAAELQFEAAVREGTGVVAIHSANNCFDGWEAYERMLGLMWRKGAGHGEFHEFTVTVKEEHPITEGLGDFQTWDELYHGLTPMHGVEYQVLATAYSDPSTGGSGLHEPMMLIRQFGQGRVFHNVLGHVYPGDGVGYKGATMVALESEGFQQSVVQGCLWAAGAVR